MKGNKILFIELDGASWNIINPLLEEGKLPNIRRLMDQGSFSGLASEAPYISPKIWTSIFTGKKPEKHGVTFFGATSNMVNTKRIWNIFDEQKLTVGILGSLVTWPPQPINGFLIPSICALGPETYPDDFVFFQEVALNERRKSKRMGSKNQKVLDFANYSYKLKSNGVRVDTFWYILKYLLSKKIEKFNQKDNYWRKATVYLKTSAQIFSHLYKKNEPDFATYHIHLCDSLAHRYWMFYEPDKFSNVDPGDIKKYKNVLPDSYIEADRAIGTILSQVDDGVNVIVASDHGSRAMPEERNTYDINIEKFLDVLGIFHKVVVARFGPGLYLNFQDKELMGKTASAIEKIALKETGEKLFFVKSFNDILVVTKAIWKVDTEKINEDSPVDFADLGTYKVNDIFSKQKVKISGIHDKEGILIMQGPDIKRGAAIDNAMIYDLTPSILALRGLPVGRDMDGRVLTELFKDEFIRENPVTFTETYEDSLAIKEKITEDLDYDKIKNRLEDLGYL